MQENQNQELAAGENLPVTPKKRNVFKIVGYITLVIVVVLAAGIAWLYYSAASPLKSKIMEKLSYPLTLVNGKPVSYKEVARRYEIAKKGNPSLGDLSNPDVGNKILNSIIESDQLNLLASKFGVSVSGPDLDLLYTNVANTTTGGDQKALVAMLDRMGVSVSEFKTDILRPQAIFTNLAIWYNGQRQYNEDSYKKIDMVQQALAQGQKFEDLAKTYSEDASSKDKDGDMGDVDVKTIWPELSKAIESMQPGEVKLVASRYGLHLLKVDSKNDQTGTYHVKQIFVRSGGDFQTWYDSQKSAYHVTTLVKHF